MGNRESALLNNITSAIKQLPEDIHGKDRRIWESAFLKTSFPKIETGM